MKKLSKNLLKNIKNKMIDTRDPFFALLPDSVFSWPITPKFIQDKMMHIMEISSAVEIVERKHLSFVISTNIELTEKAKQCLETLKSLFQYTQQDENVTFLLSQPGEINMILGIYLGFERKRINVFVQNEFNVTEVAEDAMVDKKYIPSF